MLNLREQLSTPAVPVLKETTTALLTSCFSGIFSPQASLVADASDKIPDLLLEDLPVHKPTTLCFASSRNDKPSNKCLKLDVAPQNWYMYVFARRATKFGTLPKTLGKVRHPHIIWSSWNTGVCPACCLSYLLSVLLVVCLSSAILSLYLLSVGTRLFCSTLFLSRYSCVSHFSSPASSVTVREARQSTSYRAIWRTGRLEL